MTRFAFAGKWGAFGTRESAVSAPASPRSPTRPNPAPMVCNKSLRVMLVHPLEFVGVQQYPRVFVPITLLHERQAELQLLRRGLPAVHGTIGLLHACAVAPVQSPGESGRLLFHEVTVHHVQALQGNVRDHALLTGAIRIGKIE